METDFKEGVYSGVNVCAGRFYGGGGIDVFLFVKTGFREGMNRGVCIDRF